MPCTRTLLTITSAHHDAWQRKIVSYILSATYSKCCNLELHVRTAFGILSSMCDTVFGMTAPLIRSQTSLSNLCSWVVATPTPLLCLAQAAPQSILSVLPYAIPVLEERIIGTSSSASSSSATSSSATFSKQRAGANGRAVENPCEPSEEVRLQLARLLSLLVTLAGKAISAYSGEVLEMATLMSCDPYYEVNIEACAAVLALNDALGLRLQPAAKQLVATLLPLTTHKRHRVRVAGGGTCAHALGTVSF